MAETPDSSQHEDVVEGWRMALLLLGFALVTLILELTLNYLESFVKKRKGLSVALFHIKNELLYVGFISLLLSAFQNLLAKICMPITGHGPYDRRRDYRRQLLAGATADYCGPNGQSLWPATLQHDTHIFIFVVACTHVLYSTITVYLTLIRVKAWRKWELAAQEVAGQTTVHDCPPMKIPAKWIYRNWGSNPVFHWAIMIVRQFHLSVNQTLYHNARLLSLEKLGMQLDTDFHGLVVTGLEDQLMHTLHPEWYMWLIAVVWYAVPRPAYVSYWMYGISCFVTLAIGGKLVDILVQISLQVEVIYGSSVIYGRMESVPRAHSPAHGKLGRMSVRNSSRANANPDIKRRFLERSNARRHAVCLTGTSGEEDAKAVNKQPSFSTMVEALSSKEQAKQVLRSWGDAASRSLNTALRSVLSSGSGALSAAAGCTTTRPSVELEPPPPTTEPAASDAAAASGTKAAVTAAPSVQAEGTSAAAAAAGTTRHGNLARGSAPAALRRQGLARFSIGRSLRASGDGGTGADGGGSSNGGGKGHGSAGAPIVGGGRPHKQHGVFHLLSVIKEGATSPQKHFWSQNAQHSHHQHNSHKHHNHDNSNRHQNVINHQLETLRTHNCTTATAADAAAVGEPSHDTLGNASGRSPARLGRVRSVFEQFQRHNVYHHDAMMVRRFFHPFSHHHRNATSDDPTTTATTSSPFKTTSQQEQQQPQQPIARQAAAQATPALAAAPADVTVGAAALTGESHAAEGDAELRDRRTNGSPATAPTAVALSANITTPNGASATSGHHAVLRDSDEAFICIVTDDGLRGDTNNRDDRGQGALEIEAVRSQTPQTRRLPAKGTSPMFAEGPLESVQEIGGAVPSPMPAALPEPSEEPSGGAVDAASPASPLAPQPTAPRQSTGSGSGRKHRRSGGEGGLLGCGLVRAGGGSAYFKGRPTDSGRRRHVPMWKRPCYCGAEFTRDPSEYVKGILDRHGARIQQSDTRDFFWFGRPKFLIGLFSLAYFQNSLSIAICIFTLAGLYQAKTAWEGASTWVVVLQLVLDLLLVPVVSLCVLPLYALIQPSGSHCPKAVIEHAVMRASMARNAHDRGMGRISDLRGVVRGIKAALARTSLGARVGPTAAVKATQRFQKAGGATLQRSLSGPNREVAARTDLGTNVNILRLLSPASPPAADGAAPNNAPAVHGRAPDTPTKIAKAGAKSGFCLALDAGNTSVSE